MIKLIEPEEVTGGERDILLIREMWQRYASPQFRDLLDTDHVAAAEDGPPPIIADPETIRVKPRKVADPKKRLKEVLGDDESKTSTS